MKLFLLALLCAPFVSAQFVKLPENQTLFERWIAEHYRISDLTTKSPKLDQENFERIIDEISEIYNFELRERIYQSSYLFPKSLKEWVMDHGYNAKKNWDSNTENAFASNFVGFISISMFGEVARHQYMTYDGFALIVCHELGHLIGGLPARLMLGNKMSNEGQADYFATSKCLPRYFKTQNNHQIFKYVNTPSIIRKKCSLSWKTHEDRRICERVAVAGVSAAMWLRNMRQKRTDIYLGFPDYLAQDMSYVGETQHHHPNAQCRLDTYLAGAFCNVDREQNFSFEDENTGACLWNSSKRYASRPRCWYKPQEAL